MMRSIIKKIFSFAKYNIRTPQNGNEYVNTVRIDETSITENCSFGEWIKIQKQCYFYNSFINSYTYFAGFNSVMNAQIGKFCSIGALVSIGPGKHPIEFVSTSPVFFSPHRQCGTTFSDNSYYQEMGSVIIGNDVWIGCNAVILDDVTIGDGAVIAAGAIVTTDVEPYTIVGGVPAKVIRKRFSEDTIAKLLQFRWWDKDEIWLRANFKKFHDMESFKNLISEVEI